MSFARGLDGDAFGASDPAGRSAPAYEEQRRTVRSTRLGVGTLACDRCDAPISIGSEPRLASDVLACPFCERSAPLHEFLSLAPPTRPARVIVRITGLP